MLLHLHAPALAWLEHYWHTLVSWPVEEVHAECLCLRLLHWLPSAALALAHRLRRLSGLRTSSRTLTMMACWTLESKRAQLASMHPSICMSCHAMPAAALLKRLAVVMLLRDTGTSLGILFGMHMHLSWDLGRLLVISAACRLRHTHMHSLPFNLPIRAMLAHAPPATTAGFRR